MGQSWLQAGVLAGIRQGVIGFSRAVRVGRHGCGVWDPCKQQELAKGLIRRMVNAR